jgi:GDPmannose 4,6-dehydratase
MNKKAFITGVAGQDGLFLSKFLLKKKYNVYGMIQREAHFNRSRIDPIREYAKQNNLKFELCYGDMQDNPSLYKLLSKIKPNEIYNFASQSHVHLSHEEPEITTRVNSNAVLSILDAVKFLELDSKFYQACSSELFGDPTEVPQTETTPFQPKNPYAISKLYSYWITKYYRDYYNMFTCNGILYNHESPYRGENFVTRKITYSLARIKAGLQEKLYLGNYDSERDWGFAGDYVEAMWMMLQQEKPDDFLIASGKNHSVRQFVEIASKIAGFDIEWSGDGMNEKGIDKRSGKILVEVEPKFYRKKEENKYIGNISKAKNTLGWEPKIKFEQLVQIMTEADLNLVKN